MTPLFDLITQYLAHLDENGTKMLCCIGYCHVICRTNSLHSDGLISQSSLKVVPDQHWF